LYRNLWIRSSPPGIRTSTATTRTRLGAHGRRKLPPSTTTLTRGHDSIHHPPHQWRMHAHRSHHRRTGHLQTSDSWQDPTKSRTASLTLITSAQSPERPKSARGFFYAHSHKELTDTETSNPDGWTYPRSSEGDILKMFRAQRDIKKQTLHSDA